MRAPFKGDSFGCFQFIKSLGGYSLLLLSLWFLYLRINFCSLPGVNSSCCVFIVADGIGTRFSDAPLPEPRQAGLNTHGNSHVNKKGEHLTHANCFPPTSC